MNDISTKLTENFVQDEMKYIQRLEKAWLMPIFPWFNPKRKIYTFNNKPGDAFVPTWFYWEYRDLFPKIDEFNLRIENVLRKHKKFTPNEIKEIITKYNIYIDDENNIDLKRAIEAYWDREDGRLDTADGIKRYKDDEVAYFNEYSWKISPFVGYTKVFLSTEKSLNSREHGLISRYSIREMYNIINSYRWIVPYYPGIKEENYPGILNEGYPGISDKRFIKLLIEALAELEKLKDCLDTSRPQDIKYKDMAGAYPIFIVPPTDSYNEGVYVLASQSDKGNFYDYHKEVNSLNSPGKDTSQWLQSSRSYHVERLEQLQKDGYLQHGCATRLFGNGMQYTYDHILLKPIVRVVGTDYRNKIANGYDTGIPIVEKNYNDLRTYDPKVTILAEGNHKTNIIYYDFLLNVINESSDINHDIAILNNLDINKFLIRCLGLSRVYYKQRIILTSIINWEEAFKTYIEKGWKIRYIPPIIMKDGMLQEASDDDQISILKEGKLLQKTNLGS